MHHFLGIFTNSWEQRKVEAFFDLTTPNNTLSRDKLTDVGGEVQNVHYGDVLIKYGPILDPSHDKVPYICPDQKTISEGSFLRDGDIVMADTAEDETAGKCTEISKSLGFRLVAGLHTIVMRPREKTGNFYLGYFMNSPSYHDQLKPLMQGTKVTSVNKGPLSNTLVRTPTHLEEQERIGRFFNGLEQCIVLHQREC